MNARDHYLAGDLDAAVGVMNDEVRSNPADTAKRAFLAELLCVSGNLERADKLLETVGNQDAAAAPGVALLRQQVRAETSRREFFSSGRVPEFLADPPDYVQELLRASVLFREGDAAGAAAIVAQVDEARPKVRGTCNGEPFEDLRDGNDLTSCVLEVLTSTGKYYWVPVEQIESYEAHGTERPLDLLWRRVSLSVRGGPDGDVYVPCTYPTLPADDSEELDRAKLGRMTDWVGVEGGPVQGIGLRTFLVGEEGKTILEIDSLETEEPA